jgi:hypothetical protein
MALQRLRCATVDRICFEGEQIVAHGTSAESTVRRLERILNRSSMPTSIFRDFRREQRDANSRTITTLQCMRYDLQYLRFSVESHLVALRAPIDFPESYSTLDRATAVRSFPTRSTALARGITCHSR